MYIVKITSKDQEGHKLVEKAGVRGERTIVFMASKTRAKVNPKPKALEGWKTLKGVNEFIEKDKLSSYGSAWKSTYEIIEVI